MVTGRCPVNPGSIACCTACETSLRKFDLKKCISIEIVFSGFFYLAYWIYNKRKEDEVLNKRKFVKLKKTFIENRGIIMIGFLYFVYLIVDYFNVPSRCLKLNTNNINFDFNNNAVAMLVLGIAYFTVDKINTVKNRNQREIIKIMIIEMCDECVFYANLMKECKKDIVNLDEAKKQKIYNHIKTPFTHDKCINEFVKSGYISLKEYSCLKDIKKDYEDYMKENFEVEKNNKEDMREPYYKILMHDIESIKDMLNA